MTFAMQASFLLSPCKGERKGAERAKVRGNLQQIHVLEMPFNPSSGPAGHLLPSSGEKRK